MSDEAMAGGTEPDGRSMNINMLADVSLRVTVEVGSASLTLASLLELAEGSVLELDQQANDPLDLLVNGTLIARGEIVEISGRFGIRITEVIQGNESLASLEART